MKIKSLIMASLAVLAIAACEEKPVEVPSSVELGKKSIAAAAEGDTQSVSLTANCEWNATASASWITVAPASGNGSTTLSVIIAENEGDARDGKVTVASKDAKASAELLVSQAAKKSVEPEPAGNTIKTLDELKNFFTNAKDYTADDEWSLEADIDCGGATIAPVPSFAGIFDGKNHKIYNYKVVAPEGTAGLFLSVTGTIKNVILGSKDGSKWDGTSNISYAENAATGNMGGVCAELGGTLENVKQFATITLVFNNSAVAGIGGLVGNIGSPAKISGCENYATIEWSGTMVNGAYAGGIAGHGNNAEAIIENCTNYANLEFTQPNGKYIMYGGIVGCLHNGTIVDGCTNLGAVTLNQSIMETSGTYMMIAGIAGAIYTAGVVRNCTNKADVTSNRMQVSRIGGIVGTLNSKGTIANNVNDGKVTIKQLAPNDNWQSAGGICGFQEKENADNLIQNNTNNGAVTVEVENATTHNNKVCAGGIIGLGVLGLEISGNTNNGAVSVVNKAAGPAYAGGIVGWFKGAGSFTKNNENKAPVSCKTSDDAASVAGGVVGLSSDAANTCTNDKNTGAVTCANAAAAGAIAGTNNGTLTDCKAGGSVNGTAVTASNVANLTQGASSSGTATGTSVAN